MQVTESHPISVAQPDFRLWLQQEFIARCKKNGRYSLRAFAQFIGLDSSSLSQILSGKRKVSLKLAEKICDRLSLEPVKRKQILTPFTKQPSPESAIAPNYQQMALDAFAVISEWYHYAILELTFTNNFKGNPKWIARTLGLSVVETSAALERLQRLGLLEVSHGTLKKTQKFISNYADGVTSPALKELQKQVLQMGLQAIDNIPQEEKDITSMTMAIDVNKLGEARRLIKDFRRNLCQFLEDGTQTRVYQMGIQLYPVSKKEEES